MRAIPAWMREQMAADPYYEKCARWHEGVCSGRITWEHVFIYAGQQVNEVWAILPLCWHHHLGKGLNKKINERIAVARATPEELAKYPRRNWKQYDFGGKTTKKE